MHVVLVFECVEQFLHFGSIFAANGNGVFGTHGYFGYFGGEACCFEGGFYGFKVGWGGNDFDCAVVIGDYVLCACFECGFHYLVFTGAWGKDELAAVFELESHRAFGAQIAAVFAQDVAHFGYGAHFVVGHGVNNNGCAAYAVALVAYFFVADAF